MDGLSSVVVRALLLQPDTTIIYILVRCQTSKLILLLLVRNGDLGVYCEE